MFSPDHSPTLAAWAAACIPGFAAVIASDSVRAFARSTNGPRPGAEVALSPIANVRRGVQPFAVTP